MPAPDDEERDLRIELMTVQIEQGRVNIDKMRQEMRTETRKIVIQTVASLAAAATAGAAICGLILHWIGKI
jgi:hypothetical protein